MSKIQYRVSVLNKRTNRWNAVGEYNHLSEASKTMDRYYDHHVRLEEIKVTEYEPLTQEYAQYYAKPAPAKPVAKAAPVKTATATTTTTACDGCNGSGKYYGKGHVENGVFKGFVGTCYRCQGKGIQNKNDSKRNWGYDNFYRKVNA